MLYYIGYSNINIISFEKKNKYIATSSKYRKHLPNKFPPSQIVINCVLYTLYYYLRTLNDQVMFYLRCSVVSLNIIAVYFQAQQSHLQFLTLLNASNECNTLIKSRFMSHVIITSM